MSITASPAGAAPRDRRRRRALAPAAGILLLAALAAAQLAAQTAPPAEDYKIGPKDLLTVTVVGVPEIQNMDVRVSEGGQITLPFLREVDVDGLSRTDLERRLAKLVSEKILQSESNPQVLVFIKEYMSRRVSIMGAVERPSLYELVGRQTLMWLISQAGGLSRDAGSEIIVIRPAADGTSSSLRISIDDLFFKGDTRFNIPLEPNDIVNVPVDKVVAIYVLGQVKSPGALQCRTSSLPSVVQAIAQAGGFTDRASKGGVVIKRKDARGNEQVIKVNVKAILKGAKDVPLQPNDTVYVPESLL